MSRRPWRSAASVDRRARATLVARQRETGPYYYLSSSSVSDRAVANIPAVEVETEALRAAHRRRTNRFLKGPILLAEIAAAARLPGQALAVLLAVYHRAAISRDSRVRLPRGLMQEFGVTKDAKARALRQLEAAGLIRVERRTGRAAVVELVGPATPGGKDDAINP
jgi:DNA-binding MarR family transcriptional regulator